MPEPLPASERVRWVTLGAWSGLVACAAYPALLLVPFPLRVTVLVVLLFGLALGVASVGLYHFLAVAGRGLSVQIAVVSNLLASFAFVLMGFTQLALRQGGAMGAVPRETAGLIDRVQLGLDVVWDAYLVLGTLLFALCMRRHPRLGSLFAWPGALIALALFGFNFATFPEPPAEWGLVDVGPLVGLWYLAVTIQVLRSLKWVREQERSREGGS